MEKGCRMLKRLFEGPESGAVTPFSGDRIAPTTTVLVGILGSHDPTPSAPR
jgi:hypothetical protein